MSDFELDLDFFRSALLSFRSQRGGISDFLIKNHSPLATALVVLAVNFLAAAGVKAMVLTPGHLFSKSVCTLFIDS